jgi:hypothetical protein
MEHADMQASGGSKAAASKLGLSGIEFLSGDVMKNLWDNGEAVMFMAAKKKKPAKKPGKKPAKKTPKKKPRPTRNRPGCDTTDPTCKTGR